MSLLKEYIQHLLREERTLFHGTSIFNRDSIENIGLIPDVGHFIKSTYGMSQEVDPEDCRGAFNDDCAHAWGDDNEDYERCIEDAEYECEQMADRFMPSIYFADKSEIGKAVGGMIASIAGHLGKDFHDVSDEDVERYGMLVIIKDADLQRRGEYGEDEYEDEHPAQAEPGDYYTLDEITPDLVLTGKNMLRMLRRYGEWPMKRRFMPSPKSIRETLIKLAIKIYGAEKRDEIIKKVDSLPQKDQISIINNYKKELGLE